MKFIILVILSNILTVIFTITLGTKVNVEPKGSFIRDHFVNPLNNGNCQAKWVERNPNHLERRENPVGSGQYFNRTPVPYVTCFQSVAYIDLNSRDAGATTSRNPITKIQCNWASNTSVNTAGNDANLGAGTWNCNQTTQTISVRVSAGHKIDHYIG